MAEGEPSIADRLTIVFAIEMFLRDKRSQNLADASMYKFENIFTKQLDEFCKKRDRVLSERDSGTDEEVRSTWKDAP